MGHPSDVVGVSELVPFQGVEQVSTAKAVVQKWAVVHDLLISVTSAGTVRDEDWQAFVQALLTEPITKYLATSLGKADVTSVQRKQAADILRSRNIRMAVVTNDTFVRGLVTAVGWLGANVQSFPWTDTTTALQYLAVTGKMAERSLATLAKLRREVEAL